MNYRDARQLVRDNMEVVFSAQHKPDSFAMVQATVFSRTYQAPGWARYNAADKDEGLPFSASFGLHLATGRAVKRIARRVMRIQAVQIDVAVTGAELVERGGARYLIPAARMLALEERASLKDEGEGTGLNEAELSPLRAVADGDKILHDKENGVVFLEKGRFQLSYTSFNVLRSLDLIEQTGRRITSSNVPYVYAITERGHAALAKAKEPCPA